MKIQECYVENFGGLHHYRYKPKQGLNIIYAENGGGKSTFAAFIRAMFYGLSGTRVRKNLEEAERKRYKPWQGGVWGGYIFFTVQDKSYRLERTFGEKEKEDTFRLTDGNTGLDSSDYSENIGVELFGVDRDAYMATAFINWNRMQVEVNSSMTLRLGNMTDDSGMEHLEGALAALDNEYRQYVKTGNRGLIAELEKKINDLSMQKWELEKEEKRKCAELEANKTGAQVQTETAESPLNALQLTEEERERLAFLDDYFAAGMPDLQALDERMHTAQKQLDHLNLCHIRRKAQQKRYRGFAGGLLVLTVLFLFGLILYPVPAVILAAASAAGLAGTLAVLVRICGRQKQEEVQLRQQEHYWLQAKEAADYAREYTLLWKKEEVFEAAKQEVCKQKDRNTIERITKEREEIQVRLEAIKQQIMHCKEEKAKTEKRAEILCKTKSYLLEAKRSYTLHLTDSVFTAFHQYLRAFDEELADKVCMDAAYGIEILEDGVRRQVDYYSSGTKDVIWFCERMAFAEKMYRDNRPVMILDDPFVSLDNRMRRKAFQMLETISEEFQMIYLSCHERQAAVSSDRS